jgi:hypothetical protein
MKKTVLLLIVLLGSTLISCGKSRTCDCSKNQYELSHKLSKKRQKLHCEFENHKENHYCTLID